MKEKKFKTKREKVYCLLQQEIVKGRLRPGERLFISNLAKQYEVSEIPVREALQVLVQEGYLKTAPHSGFVVSSMTKEDIREIFEIRINIESLAARLAVKHVSNANIESLNKIIDDSKGFLDCKDFEGYWEYNRYFHESVYKFCSNSRLCEMISGLYDYSRRYPRYYRSVEELEESIHNHRKIITALNSRDEELIEKLVREHTEESYNHIIQRLDEINLEEED